MSAPSMPPDNSAEVARIQAQQAEQARQAEAAAAEKRKQELATLRNNAASAARVSAQDYFSSQGLVPGDYSSAIDTKINAILSGMSPEESSPGTYFNDIGQTVYNEQQTGARNKAQKSLDTIFTPNYAETRIPYTLDDPYLTAIENEQYQKADNYLRNLLDRGVITNAGLAAGEKDLESQRAGVRSKLNEIGTTTLAGGQQKLKDVSNKARQDAANLALGTTWDPYSYSSNADQVYNDFITGLGNTLRGQLTGDLFTTSGLAALASAAGGAGNTKYDPNAVAGVSSKDDEDTAPAASIF